MRKLLMAIFMWIGVCVNSYAAHSFLPENDLHLYDDVHSFTGVDEATFNKVLDRIYSIYAPIIRNLGGNLVINRSYRNSTVNAYADRNDGNWNISFFGGLSRRVEMTEQGFVMVVCHELSHHISGFPLYSGDDWAAVEGQSDMIAAQTCMKKFYADSKLNVSSLPQIAIDKCKANYKDQDLRVCYLNVAGGKSCADLLAALGGEKIDYKLDTRVVKETQESHPSAKCRWTTYVAGAICKAKWDDAVIPDAYDHTRYNCTSGEGARPSCWYAP